MLQHDIPPLQDQDLPLSRKAHQDNLRALSEQLGLRQNTGILLGAQTERQENVGLGDRSAGR
jgi:hypothetical protein